MNPLLMTTALGAIMLSSGCGKVPTDQRAAVETSSTSSAFPAPTYTSYSPPPGGEPASAPAGKSAEPYTQATETMPILATESVCYGLCAYIWPSGLSRVAIYDDGAVSIAREQRADGRWTLAMFTLQLTAAELAEIRAAALTGGLGTGGIHAAGTTANSADGGGAVFFSRQGALGTVIEAPLLDETSVAWGDGDHTQRAALYAVRKKLDAIAERSDAKPIKPAAYLSRGVDGGCRVIPAAEATPAVANGLMLLGLESNFTEDPKTDKPSGRPLLPHEKACADVQAWDSILAADSRAKLVSPLGR